MSNGGPILDTGYILYSQEEKIKKHITDDPITNQTDALLYQAIITRASDIHLQPEEDSSRVRYRIDGTLYDQAPISHHEHAAIISRIKILSQLDIAITRLPQDGKLKLIYNNMPIDLRIATFPSTYGEKLVIRILDRSHNLLNIHTLGFAQEQLNLLRKIIKKPHGFFLVTGPTGSGKTTTLYALLSHLNNPTRNIITMEDPVEYDLEGITQSQVNIKTGFTFDNGLRSLLRQDPDIIMIGEIRDKQTVQIAIESALTGHLVLSTLHTNDAAGAITRLLDMNVEPFLINATLTGILAQRLVRLLCPHCKKEQKPTADEIACAKYHNFTLTKKFTAPGCINCFNLGHQGRTSIFELLIPTNDINNLIMHKASCEKIRQQAINDHMQTLAYHGLTKVNEGLISFEEFLIIVPTFK